MAVRFTILLILTMWSGLTLAQDINLDKLEMLYDQGHLKMVLRRSERLLKQTEYKNHPLPLLYKSMSTFRLSLEKKRFEKLRSEALRDFAEFRKRDENGYYYRAHEHEIYEIQIRLYDLINELHHAGKQKDAKLLYDQSVDIFRQKLTYEDVVREKPAEKITVPKDPSPPMVSGVSRRDSIIDFAKQFLGVPYKWAGNDPSGFDCSGYTKYVMKHFGYNLHRIAGDQYYQNCEKIAFSEAKKGDLIFFGPSGDKVTHVGIVCSDKGEPIRMIHAGSSGGIAFSEVEKNSYWKPLMLFVGRLVKD